MGRFFFVQYTYVYYIQWLVYFVCIQDPTTMDEHEPTTMDEHEPTTMDEHEPTTMDEHEPTTTSMSPLQWTTEDENDDEENLQNRTRKDPSTVYRQNLKERNRKEV